MVHPAVRGDALEARRLVESINDYLAADGWEFYESETLSGHAVFDWRRRDAGLRQAVADAATALEVLSSDYISRQHGRMAKAVDEDPELAIGSAKDLVESVCKALIVERGATLDPNADLPRLAKDATRSLGLSAEDIPDAARGADTIKRLLANQAAVVHGLAELRNLYGTGHGRGPRTKGLQPRHARLAVGAATTFVTFAVETHVARPPQLPRRGRACRIRGRTRRQGSRSDDSVRAGTTTDRRR
jgi:hypothetical protein